MVKDRLHEEYLVGKLAYDVYIGDSKTAGSMMRFYNMTMKLLLSIVDPNDRGYIRSVHQHVSEMGLQITFKQKCPNGLGNVS